MEEGKESEKIGEQEEGKVWERNRDSSDTESEREEGRLIYMPCVSQHIHTHSDAGCDVRELVINGILPDFIISYILLPSARDLCIHHFTSSDLVPLVPHLLFY